MNTGIDVSPRGELAHYYGDWFWNDRQIGWIKSLLLFFDGLALALPSETATYLIDSDPVLAQPLSERGLLQNYPPDLWLKSPYPESRRAFKRFLRVQEKLGIPAERDLFHTDIDVVLGKEMDLTPTEYYKELRKFNQLLDRAKRQYGDGKPPIKALAVAVTSRLLSQNIQEVAIASVIEDESAASFVASIIGGRDNGLASVVISDLTHINLDLTDIPLDEVLDFRRDYGAEYRAYARQVRQFVLDLSLMSKSEQSFALAARRTELDDRAEHLRRIGRTAFGRQAVVLSFGVAGAAWTLAHGDFWAAAFTVGAALAGIARPTPGPIGTAYTYILTAKATMGRQGR
jgi:hypothetical protein